MKALFILAGLFIFSFIISYIWSYIIVCTKGFDNQLLSERKISMSKFVEHTKMAVWNFVFVLLVTCISIWFIGDDFFSFEKISVWQFAISFVIMVVADDIWFYGIHRLMHKIPFLYKKIHIVHHRAAPPIPIDYLYTHPIEAMTSSMGLMIGAMVLVALFGVISIYVFAAYVFYRTMHELVLHSSLTIIPKKWLGFIGSSEHHYLHHKHLNGNYGSAFNILDKIFGTELKK